MSATHAARMDRIYAGQRHVYDLTRKYYLLGRDRLITHLDPPAGGHVLEIGCGTGRNLILAARRYPQAIFHGLDISEAMLETAATAVARAGLGGRIHLERGDAAAFDAETLFGRHRFERVFLSYTLSMIPRWRSALRQGAELLAPGGRLHLVDFGQQEGLPLAFRKGLFAWLARFEVTPREDLAEAVDEFAHALELDARFSPAYRGYAWQVVLTSRSRG